MNNKDIYDALDYLDKLSVKVLFIQTPIAEKIQNLTPFEEERIATWEFDFNNISTDDCKKIKDIYGKDTDIHYLQQLYDGAKIYEVDGIKYLADFRSKYVNIINGNRVTYYQPEIYDRTVYVFGQCTARGTGVEDKETVSSFLQSELNYHNLRIRVVNCAIGCGSDLRDDLYHINYTHFSEDDIVVVLTDYRDFENVLDHEIFSRWGGIYDCSSQFNRPHNYGEWFTDMTCHTNSNGNRIIAKYIYSLLQERRYFINSNHKDNQYRAIYEIDNKNDDKVLNRDISLYIESVKKHLKNPDGDNVVRGAIVANCNPFTLGHLYLVEEAAKQVDELCLFVVEEDKSEISFKDRYELVKKGTSNIRNVCVIPSGKFIISAITFPGYFYKYGNREIEVDATLDVIIFRDYIAKRLAIKKRFLGEEPIDYVTSVYNKTIKTMLPSGGIEVIELPRIKIEDRIVSASYVRELIANHNILETQKYVPNTTYKYLLERYVQE